MTRFAVTGAYSRARPRLLVLILSALSISMMLQDVGYAGTFAIAKKYVGLHETKHNGKLSRYLGINPRRTPWCGAFVGTVVKRAGKTVPDGYLRAASWKTVGKPVTLKRARAGDIVVVRTKYGNHVGFYAGQKNGKVQLLGGNQSNRRFFALKPS